MHLRNPLALALSLVLAGTAAAQQPFWLPSTGPDGAQVRSLVTTADGSVLAGTLAGLYRSTDDGRQWTLVAPELRPSAVRELIRMADSAIIAVIGDGLILRSTDNGLSFVEVGRTFANPRDAIALGTFVLVSHDAGLTFSNNAGRTWTRMTGAPERLQSLLSVADTILALSEDSLVASSDSGRTWSRRNISDFEYSPEAVVASGDQLFLHAADGDDEQSVSRSTDGGRTWTSAVAGLEGLLFGYLASAGDHVYLSTIAGLARWDTASERWVIIAPLLESGVVASIIITTPSGDLLAMSQDGLFRSSDAGVTWHYSSGGMTDLSIVALAAAPNGDVYAASDGSVFRSTDLGATWLRMNLPFGARAVAATATGAVLVGAWDGIRRSTDFGATWTRDSLGRMGDDSQVTQMIASSDGTVYAFGQHVGIMRSTDDGRSWQSASDQPGYMLGPIAVDRSGAVYSVLRYDQEIRRSSDRGETWVTLISDLGVASDVSELRVLENGDIVASLSNGPVMLIDDTTGIAVAIGPDGANGSSTLEIDRNGFVYVADRSLGVMRRQIAGGTWESVQSGLASLEVDDLLLHPSGYLFAAVDAASVQRSASRVAAVRTASGIDAPHVVLRDDVIHVSTSTDLPASVRVTVRDVRGRAVAAATAATASVTISMADAPSGVYFVEVVLAGSGSLTPIVVTQ